MKKIYEFRYNEANAEQYLDRLIKFLKKPILIDCRFSPYGKKGWNKEEMERKYGNVYHWVKALGNENYRLRPCNRPDMKIHDLPTGLSGLVRCDYERYEIILMCACASLEGCHLSLILEQLSDFEVVRYGPPMYNIFNPKPAQAEQIALFDLPVDPSSYTR